MPRQLSGGARSGGVRRGDAPSKGQVLVLFALGITVLFGAAGLAFDVGRFLSERRFLQNAADAAALAGANALIRGETVAQAEARARESLTLNLARSPSGSDPALPPTPPVYADGHAGDPEWLINGILISGGEVRVAVQNPLGYTFGRFVGLDQSTVGAQARALGRGNMMPVAVRRYVHLPGPITPAPASCTGDETQFMDFFATANTACFGSETNSALRTEPSAGQPFDAANPGSDPVAHGPVVAILGQGAQPSNGSDFRGFIALDIRNFAASGTQLYYNNVTASTNSNTLKSMEANWVYVGGYPGPQFPAVVSPPDPNDQVAIMSGNSTGVVIDAVNDRFEPGEEILLAVYSGNTMAIPDFTITPPATIALPTTGVTAAAGAMKVSANQQFLGSQVTLTTIGDPGDANNPITAGTLTAPHVTYVVNPVTPSLGSGTTVNLTNMTTVGATTGIYTIWVQGQAGAPYLTTKLEPIPIKVGTVSRDFTITADASIQKAANVGDTVAFELSLKRVGGAYGANVNLSVDGPLPTGMGAVTFSSAAVTPTNGNGTQSTLTINTGTMAPGRHRLVVRATGLNGDATPRPVTHLLQLWVDVATGSSAPSEYVDIVGFAVMRIATMDTNTISAYAITPVIADPNDSRLLRGQVARLVPWN
ncbi:MAG TPA: pilus assembly protein TadG-related protein [Candidatus Limnocylindrales bacterium]|nr:pilus assembly protein TadG-related protein [Candidatus Limnocylindrales bacterium]